MRKEFPLATIPGENDGEQLVVTLLEKGPCSKVALRQQGWADGIGWYDLKTLELDLDQLRQLRSVLGWTGSPRLRQQMRTHGQVLHDADEEMATLPFPSTVRIETA